MLDRRRTLLRASCAVVRPRCNPTRLTTLCGGGMAAIFGDSVYYEHAPTLEKYHQLLAVGSSTLHSAYLKEDFTERFTSIEHEWYARLWARRRRAGSGGHEGVCAPHSGACAFAAQAPVPARASDETVYHRVLRNITTISTTVVLGRGGHLAYRGRLFVENSYQPFSQPTPQGQDRPDAQESLAGVPMRYAP
jgi:hypothetical protein